MKELMTSGTVACQGCGATIAMRHALGALGENTIVIIPACCWSIIAGPFPYSSLKVPLFHTAFETAASVASGVRAALKIKGKDSQVVAWAGDGGTFDIGIQALSGAVERETDFIYVCYDNEAYMNTGIQRSSSTPFGAWTTTTPVGESKAFKLTPKKNMMEIMASHKMPYVATANIAYPEDLQRKFKKAGEIKGSKYIQIFSPCTPGWKIPPHIPIRLGRLAVDTCIYPLYEIENGRYKINRKPRIKKPVTDYLKLQGRFSHVTSELAKEIQRRVDEEWNILLRKEEVFG
ncbi:MAG: 3-methyl-2-oxobutanoate dehydrogenase subunit beta [Candidatus Methanofastidiosia archaeon]